MSETLQAVIIGGVIAIVGSAATQTVLFWLNNRKERKRRLRFARQQYAKSIYFHDIYTSEEDELLTWTEVEKRVSAEFNGITEEQIDALLGYAEAYEQAKEYIAEELLKQNSPTPP